MRAGGRSPHGNVWLVGMAKHRPESGSCRTTPLQFRARIDNNHMIPMAGGDHVANAGQAYHRVSRAVTKGRGLKKPKVGR